MPPLNDLYVTTHVKNNGLEADFCDAPFEPDRYAAIADTGFRDYQAVALLTSTQSFVEDAELLAEIKQKHPALRSILFGSHPTFMPQYCLANPAIDYIVMREPEETMLRLLQCLKDGASLEKIAGIGFRTTNGKVVITEPRPFMDMDDLPIPDRTLLPKGVEYFNPVIWKAPYTTMQTSRGCPGKCIFCTAPEFYGRKIRYRSTENVLKEMRILKEQGFKEIFFRDETFTAYRERNREICRAMIEENLNLSWIANGRVDMIDRDTMRLMKKAGCHMLKFGVESGSEALLKAYRKGTTLEQARRTFQDAAAEGLETHAHIVLGGPGETPETLEKTIAFVKGLRPTTASFGLLTPYPGTELFRRVQEKHPEIRDGSASNMANLHIDGFYSETISGMNGKELNRWLIKFYRSFYLRPGYLLKRLAGIRSASQAMSLLVAGLNIFNFSISGKK